MARILMWLVVVFAALRVSWFVRRLPLDRLVERIRRVPVLPEGLRRPELCQTLVNRWYTRLPPRGLRSCLKRSYLLLDLWTRCGLQPEFHLGVRTIDETREGHAWLVASGMNEGINADGGYEDAFVA